MGKSIREIKLELNLNSSEPLWRVNFLILLPICRSLPLNFKAHINLSCADMKLGNILGTSRIARAFTRLVLEIKKIACRCIFT